MELMYVSCINVTVSLWLNTDQVFFCQIISVAFCSKTEVALPKTIKTDGENCSLTLWWRAGARHYKAGQRDGTGGSTLQWNREETEVTEHFHNREEAQVLHPALTPFC